MTEQVHPWGDGVPVGAPPAANITAILAEAGQVTTSRLIPLSFPSGVEIADVRVEEWVYGIPLDQPEILPTAVLVLIRRPFEVDRVAATRCLEGFEVRRFVVVLEWIHPTTERAHREIGPWFQPRPGSLEDRAAGLRAAMTFARGLARELHLSDPSPYWPAREL